MLTRSTAIDPSLLRETRYRLGWTQEELAFRAGLGLRVVAKAEAGKPVRHKTVRALSQAFELAGASVDLLPSQSDPLAVVLPILKSYKESASDGGTLRAILADTLVATIDGCPEWTPLASIYRGPTGFEQLWTQFFAQVYRESGDLGERGQLLVAGHEVIAWGYELLRADGGHETPASLVVMRFTVEKDQLVRFKLQLDPSAVAGWNQSAIAFS